MAKPHICRREKYFISSIGSYCKVLLPRVWMHSFSSYNKEMRTTIKSAYIASWEVKAEWNPDASDAKTQSHHFLFSVSSV